MEWVDREDWRRKIKLQAQKMFKHRYSVHKVLLFLFFFFFFFLLLLLLLLLYGAETYQANSKCIIDHRDWFLEELQQGNQQRR